MTLTLVCSTDANVNQKPSLLAVHHMLFEIVVGMESIVLLAYWSLLHKSSLEIYRRIGGETAVVHTYLIHSLPALALLVNFLLTDLVIKASHCKMYVWLALVFGYANYVATIRNGEPIYWFLTWEDWKSPAIIVAIAVVVSAMYLILAHLSWIIKRGDSSSSEERETIRTPRKIS